MAVSLKHKFQSAIPDSGDTTIVQPSNWNDDHDLTMAADRILGRVTMGTGLAEELTSAQVRTLINVEDGADVTDATNVAAAGAVMDGDFSTNGLMKRTGAGTYSVVTDNSTNWDTAYGWGDHSGQGYLTSVALDGVSDVVITTPADNEVLAYDSGSGNWINQTAAEAGLAESGHNHSGVYEPVDADILRADTGDTLTAGFLSDSYSRGTISSGTVTPAPSTSEENIQHYTNNGAHTLAPPASPCTVVIEVTNGASAGTITTSGFTIVTGDALTTTNGHDFIFYITKTQNFSHLNVVALQ